MNEMVGPPVEEISAWEHWSRWARENLFSSAFNTILTFVTVGVVYFFIRGAIGYAFAPERKWFVVPPNMKLYWTDVYPVETLWRLWLSLAIVFFLTGVSLAVWRFGGRLSPSRLATILKQVGGGFLILGAFFAWPTSVRLTLVIGGAILVGFAYLGLMLWKGSEDLEIIPLLRVLFVVMLLILVGIWLMHIAQGTKVWLTIEFGVLVGSYLVGLLVRRFVPGVVAKAVLVGFWVLSLPLIYLVVERDPDLSLVPVATLVIPAAAIFAVVGVAYLWWAGGPDPGEAARAVAAAFVLIAIGMWFTPLAMLIRFLMLALAGVALLAPTFGGTESGRRLLVGVWVVVDLVIAYFVAVSMGATGIPAIGGYIGGLNMTFLLAIAGISLSFPIGVVLALARTSSLPIFRMLSTGYIEVVRGVPLITVLFFGNLVINRFLPADVHLDNVVKAIVAIALFSAAYLAENVRGGLQSIPKGQYEAAHAVGLSTVQMTALITLPQALRAVIPAIVGQVISLFKDTSLVAIIGLADFLRIARDVAPNQPEFLGSQQESLLFALAVYWVFSFSVSRGSQRLEKKLGVGER